MSKEKNSKRKRSARARQKQKLMITGGLAILLIVLVVLALFVFGSCGTYDVDRSTVFVEENGKIVSATMEDFDEETYSEDELKEFIKSAIEEFNNENGEKAVKQKSFSVKDGVATLVMEYANESYFKNFEGTEIFVGSIAEAMEAGYAFDSQFASVAGGVVREASLEDFVNDSEYQVVVIKANTKVVIDGVIYYVSTENVDSVGEDWIITKSGAANLLAAGTENVGDEVTEATEVEGADGAISEDELLLETEQELIFDFGDGEEEAGSQYSEVYTYIIYKVK